MDSQHLKKVSAGGLLIALGIIYGDIGTSPLYVFSAIVGGREISDLLVYGAISCIFWTLTLQTTFKYVFLTLQADNKGEGGVFSLYALVRRYRKSLYIPAIIGAGMLLADGIITPPISVSSAIEGLRLIQPDLTEETVSYIVYAILTALFFFQQFGTNVVGRAFGPIMFVWFLMIAGLGVSSLIHYPHILAALNPYYAFNLLAHYPNGFWMLGAVFLATTGAEALYSDLGHCGLKNIRVSWIFVKTALVLNYLGQGAWLLSNKGTGKLVETIIPKDILVLYEMVPHDFLLVSIIIATIATIIASQALITGSFTLISEALSLNFWPRVTVKYPSNVRGQIYIPSINWILWASCCFIMYHFKNSTNMQAAYGFSITVAMLMTTFLMANYMRYVKKWSRTIIVPILAVFLTVEISFFIANAAKFEKLWVMFIFGLGLISIMYIWHSARKINNRFLTFVNLTDNIPALKDLSADKTISKFATHLIYLTKANHPHQIENKIIYSIFSHQPKRADVYWFVHVERTDEPYTLEYDVEELEDDKVIRVEFRLGFRVESKINVMFRKVVEDMVKCQELDIKSPYPSLSKYNVAADFRFVVLEKFLSFDNKIKGIEPFILNAYFGLKKLALSDPRAFGLDPSETSVEKIPLLVSPVTNLRLKRVHLTKRQKVEL